MTHTPGPHLRVPDDRFPSRTQRHRCKVSSVQPNIGKSRRAAALPSPRGELMGSHFPRPPLVAGAPVRETAPQPVKNADTGVCSWAACGKTSDKDFRVDGLAGKFAGRIVERGRVQNLASLAPRLPCKSRLKPVLYLANRERRSRAADPLRTIFRLTAFPARHAGPGQRESPDRPHGPRRRRSAARAGRRPAPGRTPAQRSWS